MSEIDSKYKKVANAIVKAGVLPIPTTETFINILKMIIDDDELDFILSFKRKSSQNMEQLKKNSKLTEEEITKMAEGLAKKGVIFNQPNSQGQMVFRLLPVINVGLFEYTFMKELEVNDYNKKLADLFTKLFAELDGFVQNNYEGIMPVLQKAPPVDRTIPIFTNESTGGQIEITINQDIEIPKETIVPSQKIGEIIDKFDDIAVAHCFCRHHKDLDGISCTQTNQRENCFTFGKSARHVTQQGFGRMVSKEEAKKIMEKAEVDGLVHKAYHPNSNVSRPETSICNCCKCCCGNSYDNAIAPVINATNYLSSFNHDLCVGCGTCIDKCVNNAISLTDDNKADRIAEFCIGCGVCAHFCPENAISLMEGQRVVNIPPPKK